MCLNVKYSKVWVGKDLSDRYPVWSGLKQDALSPLLFNCALEYDIRRVQVNKDGLKLNGSNQFMVYTDVNILGGSVHTIKENAEVLVEASMELGLEVNADETEYMVMSGDRICRTKSQY